MVSPKYTSKSGTFPPLASRYLKNYGVINMEILWGPSILLSIVLSVVLTIALNLIFRR